MDYRQSSKNNLRLIRNTYHMHVCIPCTFDLILNLVLRCPAERVDPGEYGVSACIMLKRAGDMKRHKEFAICANLLVNLEALPSNCRVSLLGFLSLDDTRDGSTKEGQSLATIVSHGNTRSGHNRHERIEQKVGRISSLMLKRPCTRNMSHAVLGCVK
mmetsp:Transcript_15669/g.34052  ORF Transcript_15669/g.34052 Transcript_15669/m.34052 type:complete len:158 (-) Transcript_15669:227-700(-)